MTRSKYLTMAALGLLLSQPAVATVYTGMRAFGGGLFRGRLTITTDGTLGVLGAANITAFRLRLSGLREDAAIYGYNPVIEPDERNPLVLQGTSLVATRTSLLFDFDSGGGVFGVLSGPYYVLWAADCVGCLYAEEFLELDPEFGLSVYPTGVQMLGSSVPEPANWAMLIAGFGLVGAARRRRRAVAERQAVGLKA